MMTQHDAHSIGDDRGHRINWSLLVRNREIFLLVMIVLIALAASLSFKTFPTAYNLKMILLNMSTEAIVSVGMMILLISGVFDLSVGSVMGLSGAVAASLMFNLKIDTWLAILLALSSVAAVGMFNGVMIAWVGVNPLIVTLAMMGAVRGLVELVAGTGIIDLPDNFVAIADQTIAGLRIPVWYMIVIAAAFSFLVSKTSSFRKYYYIGVNQEAAEMSGINVKRLRVLSFIIVAVLSGIAGIIVTSRLGQSTSDLGNGLEFRCITACVLGGASIFGGNGSIPGAFLGTLFVALINDLMIISGVSGYWQMIVIGAILVIAVALDAMLRQGRFDTQDL